MMDLQTGSYWSHITGKCLRGKMKDTQLQFLPSVQTTWGKWVAEHPETKVLKKTEEVKSSAYKNYFSDPKRTGLFRAQWLQEKLPGKELVYGVQESVHAAAVTNSALEKKKMLRFNMGGIPVLFLKNADGGARAYKISGRVEKYNFQLTNIADEMVEISTNSRWSMQTGKLISGNPGELRVVPLMVTRVFWFAWSSFYPNTIVVEE